MEIFEQAINWVKHFCRQGTQLEVNLFGVGESTMNPNLVKMVEYARNRLPIRQKLHLNTNGILMTPELAKELKKARISEIDVTYHGNARVTANTIRILMAEGIAGQLSVDPVTRPNNWAGQVDWLEPDYSYPCPWLGRGQAMVMSDGNVTRCCIDAFATGLMGTIFDDLTEMVIESFDLCYSCHQTIPETMKRIEVRR